MFVFVCWSVGGPLAVSRFSIDHRDEGECINVCNRKTHPCLHEYLACFDLLETAATTACMLTNAMIVDSPVTVKPYFEDDTTDDAQENKPRARILAELLAAGYKIQDAIIEKGLELDAKLGVTGRVQGYVETVKATAIAQAHAIDEKFKVTEKASELDNKYHVQDRVNAAVEQGIGYKDQVWTSVLCRVASEFVGGRIRLKVSHAIFYFFMLQALQSAPGQKVTNIAVQVKDQIAAVHHEARRIADEKKTKGHAQSGEAAEAQTEAPAEVPATKEA